LLMRSGLFGAWRMRFETRRMPWRSAVNRRMEIGCGSGLGRGLVSDDVIGERADSRIWSLSGCVFSFFPFLLPRVKPEYLWESSPWLNGICLDTLWLSPLSLSLSLVTLSYSREVIFSLLFPSRIQKYWILLNWNESRRKSCQNASQSELSIIQF
jgi:hypothetical protein